MKFKLAYIFVFVSTLLLISCWSDGGDFWESSSINEIEPEFDNQLAYVIDTYKINGSMEDNVKLVNRSTDSNIDFNIYVYQPQSQQWFSFGIGSLKDSGDTDTIDSFIDDDLDEFRYFAIEPLNGKKYSYSTFKKNNDLYIDILNGIKDEESLANKRTESFNELEKQLAESNLDNDVEEENFGAKRAADQLNNKRIAIVGIDSVTNSVSQETLDALVLFVENSFVNTGRVTVVDRKSIEKIIEEYNFQRSGLTDEETAVEIGKIAGAEVIVNGTLSMVGSTYYLQLRLINVQTAEVIASSLDKANIENEFLHMSNQAVQHFF